MNLKKRILVKPCGPRGPHDLGVVVRKIKEAVLTRRGKRKKKKDDLPDDPTDYKYHR